MGKIVVFVVIALIVVVGAFLFIDRSNILLHEQKVSNYDECVAAGYEVLESYPPTCQTPNGQSFTRDIGNGVEFSDEIQVISPKPGEVISSPLTVSGEALGTWYFEGSFSGELFDNNGNSLGEVVLQAEGDWMSEEFVPFKGELLFDESATGKGVLIIDNANPSGLAENSKSVTIPVAFDN